MTEKKSMLSVDAALAYLLDAAIPIEESECVDILQAGGRILAQAQKSSLNVPPMDNSAMDGYAVRAADCLGKDTLLRISQRIPAGHLPSPLEAGTAARIFTGAAIPPGADSVVMQEHCELVADEDKVMIRATPTADANIRRAGEDIQAGSVVLPAGTRLRAQEVGLAASIGLAALPVARRLRVAVFFTGDELTMPGEPLKPGAIYNSNRFTLRTLLHNLGCEITDFGAVPDSLAATRDVLRNAAQEHDLIISSGGVSVGEEDHVKAAMQAEGEIDLWQIAVKPGKPLAFGKIARSSSVRPAFFLGLPGNPVSSFVTFLLFARPFILKLQGTTDVLPKALSARADFAWSKSEQRRHFLRVRINDRGGLDIFPNQGSGILTSTVWGDGLVDLPPDGTIAPGDLVAFFPFSALMT